MATTTLRLVWRTRPQTLETEEACFYGDARTYRAAVDIAQELLLSLQPHEEGAPPARDWFHGRRRWKFEPCTVPDNVACGTKNDELLHSSAVTMGTQMESREALLTTSAKIARERFTSAVRVEVLAMTHRNIRGKRRAVDQNTHGVDHPSHAHSRGQRWGEDACGSPDVQVHRQRGGPRACIDHGSHLRTQHRC